MMKQRDILFENDPLAKFREYNFSFMELIECTDFNNFTPLLTSVKYDRFDIFNYLISIGCNLNTYCKQMNNALHYAVMNKSTVFILKIMELDSDRNSLLFQQNI